MIQRAGRTRRSQIIAPAILPPSALASKLRALLFRLIRTRVDLVTTQVMPRYERTVAAADGIRDSVDDVQGEMDRTNDALSRLVVAIGPELEDWIVRVEEWHRGRFSQLFTPAGVRLDTLLGRADVTATLQSVLAENIALIRSLNEQMANGISGAVFRGLTNRDPAREVAREIRRVTAIGRRRAELIAADQLQKLTARLDQERQEQVGITSFQWAHSRKKHPRPEHVARDGIVYRWDSVVARTDPPGRAIRCGCRARPVVELDAVAP